jgi:hypothetical protein
MNPKKWEKGEEKNFFFASFQFETKNGKLLNFELKKFFYSFCLKNGEK